jgi:hypothetical protein
MLRRRAVLFASLLAACARPPPPVAIGDTDALAAALSRAAPGLERAVAARAITAYRCAAAAGKVGGPLLTVIDFSRPSTERRLWVLDLVAGKVVFHELVAHGSGSGEAVATRFSNTPQSKATSLGLFTTLGTYDGKHGLSLKLRGLEPGVNDNAESRSIVVHGADYVSPRVVKEQGRLGRSWGCPAVEVGVAPRLIEAIKGGMAVFAYAEDPTWLAGSPWLRCGSDAGAPSRGGGP